MNKSSQYIVEVIDNSFIKCTLIGRIDGTTVHDSLKKTNEYVDDLRQKGLTPKLLIDISRVSSTTSGARLAAKQISETKFVKIAIVGGSRRIRLVGQYIVNAGKMGDYTRFFRSTIGATNWLKNTSYGRGLAHSGSSDAHTLTTTIISFSAIIIPIIVLIGWATNNETLKRIHPGLTSMNPITALSFIALGIVLFIFSRRSTPPWLEVLCKCLLGLLSIVALCVLFRFFFHIEVPVDRWLFHDRLDSPGYPPSKMAPNVALCFILISLSILSDRSQRLAKTILPRILLIVASICTIVALFGYTYGYASLYQIGSFIPMALHTAILIILVIFGIYAQHKDWPITRRLRNSNPVIWVGIIVAIMVLSLTGIGWRQNQDKIKQDQQAQFNQDYTAITGKIDQRLAIYSDVLTGFRSFFVASDSVSRGDFHTYFDGLNLSQSYPGVRSVSFIRHVTDKDAPQFITEMRRDTSQPAQLVPNYSITPVGKRSEYYLLAYAEPTTNSTFGYDLSTDALRLDNLRNAEKTAGLSASSTVNYNVINPTGPVTSGFFITIPIYKSSTGKLTTTKTDQSYGFINTSFEYEKLFSKLLDTYSDNGLTIKLFDATGGTPLYQRSGMHDGQPVGFEKTSTIYAAGRPWKIAVMAAKGYKVNRDNQLSSQTFLVGGISAAFLLMILFLNLARSRNQAVDLASKMTSDLHAERDAAVAVREKDDAILSSIGDAVFATDTHGHITLFNPAAAQISGYTEEEALGKPYGEILKFVHEKSGTVNDAFVKRALDGFVTSMKNHTVIIHKNGTQTAVADSAAPIRDGSKQIIGAIIVFRDVSKEQALDVAKSEFVSLASHQLRTPLSAINWFVALLQDKKAGKLTKKQHEYVQQILEGNQRMIALVNSLLDVSRLDLGKFSNIPSAVNISETIDSLSVEMKPTITEKNIHLVVDIGNKLPHIMIDPKLIRMVIQNLYSNAVKYTPAGGTVKISAKNASPSDIREAGLTHGKFAILHVTDTGYGIPADQQDKIFGKMFRASNAQTLGVEGTGLGLYIVREIVQKVGGRVWFTSQEKVGSTFSVLIPLVTKASKTKDISPEKKT